jgi:hypothetical protein
MHLFQDKEKKIPPSALPTTSPFMDTPITSKELKVVCDNMLQVIIFIHTRHVDEMQATGQDH